jgi:hypothetical protein
MLDLLIRSRLGTLKASLILTPDTLRLGQEPAHVLPDGGVQHIGANLFVPTEALAAEAIGVGARAAVVRIGDPALAPGRGPARRLAVAAIAAPFADDQTLEQVTPAARPVATTLPVLLQLSLDCPEKIFAHQPWDFDDDLIFR